MTFSVLLASRGIASQALAYFAYDDLPKITDTFDLEYFEEAVGVLLTQSGVVEDRCGVVAVSKATDIAFCMATWPSQVTALVSISGTPVAFDSVLSYRGEVIMEGFKINMSDMVDEHGKVYLDREAIRREMDSEHPKFIPFHLADDEMYFLMVAGSVDAWSTDIPVASTRQRMEKFGRSNQLETVIYPGAGHILEPPYWALIHHSSHRHSPVVADDGSQKVQDKAWDTC